MEEKNLKPNSSLAVKAEKGLISLSSGLFASYFFRPGEHLFTGAAVMEKPVCNSLGGKERRPLWGSPCG